MQTATAPARSLQQRQEALERANEIRIYRAALKRDMRHGRVRLVDALDDPMLDSMKILKLLLALPAVGRVKADKALRRAAISPNKTIGGLSARQRSALLQALGGFPSVARRTMRER